jgi:RNA-binding protein
LQRLGRALHISPSRKVIMKVEKIPKIGETVVDEDLKPVGRISDVFGPVSSPYVSVKTAIRQSERLTNKMLYVLPSKRRK